MKNNYSLKEIIQDFNYTMFAIRREDLTLDTPYSEVNERYETWTIRDMVCECLNLLECACEFSYEHAYELSFVDIICLSYQKCTLSQFIDKYQDYSSGFKCFDHHESFHCNCEECAESEV